MSEPAAKAMDPRIRRTRQLLHDALGRLLESKDYEAISVQDIADAATLNRATFYDHYPDKSALLKCVVAVRFQALLDRRGVRFDGTCGSALGSIALGVCDYLAGLPDQPGERGRSLEPHLESAVVTVVRDLILDGLKRQEFRWAVPLEMTAATLGWAIYGGAREWLDSLPRPASAQAATTIATLLKPILVSLAESASTGSATEDLAAPVTRK